MNFYVGLHQSSDAQHFDRCMVSVSRLRERKSDFQVREWMMDSGAFMELKLFGAYRDSVAAYAAQVRRWSACGQLVAAVAQDYMCEPFMLERTGLDVATHQRLTIERYDQLVAEQTGVYVLPVLQGFAPLEYVAHLAQYGARLVPRAWVGVGSVCKRNADPSAVRDVLYTIARARPDLRLHGFGLKATAVASPVVRELLSSADSMAWSYAARREGAQRERLARGARGCATDRWRGARRLAAISGGRMKNCIVCGRSINRGSTTGSHNDTRCLICRTAELFKGWQWPPKKGK